MSSSTKERIKWYDENGVRCDPGGKKYLIKYDPFRTNGLRFTALCPSGRLGPDVATKAAALGLIRKAEKE